MKRLFIISVILLSVYQGHAQQHDQFVYQPKSYVCMRTAAPPSIDGRLDEASWHDAPWTDDFQDIEGPVRPAPYFQTRAKMLWDEDYLYIAAELQETHLWATYDQRDMVIFDENDFEVFIDPDGDTHHYMELEINALGTIWDLMLTKPYRDGGRAIDAWDIGGIKKGVSLDGTLNDPSDLDKQWTIELALPWSVLQEVAPRKIPQNGDIWRMNFSRVHWRLTNDGKTYSKEINPTNGKPFPEYNWVWSQQGAIAMHQPETWGFVQFSTKNVKGSKTSFSGDPKDPAKWRLRHVYYLQSNYHDQNGSFAQNFETLATRLEVFDGMQMFVTPTSYEVILDGWSLFSDGRIQKSQ